MNNTRVCKICGKEFVPMSPNSRYCSFLCKEMGTKVNAKAWNDKNKGYITIYMREYRKKRAKEA